MRTPAVALVSAVASGAVMFFAGRMSSEHASAPGTAKSGPGVERTGAEGAASPLDALKAKAAELPWAKERGANGVLSAAGMENAIHSILSDPNPIEAMEKFTALLKELTPENAEAAWAAVKKQATGFDGMRYLSMLGYTWGKLDGPAAMKALAEDRSRESFMGRMSAMNGWATADSATALAWLQEQEAAKDPNEDQNGRGRGRGGFDETAMLKRSLVSAIAQTDPDGAMKLIATMPEDQRGGLMDAVVQAQLKQGPEAAAKWAASLTDPTMKASAITGIAREYANQDPAAAAKWLSESGSVNADAAGEIAREWARKDPDATIAWLEKLPAGEAQANGYQDAFRSWSREDPAAASTYLTTMEPGSAKDSAVSALARSISREDPTGAIEWAATITDEKTRTETLIRAAQSWRMQDAAAADTWISGSGLPAEVQQQMAEPMRFDRGDFGGGPPGFGGGGPGGGGPGGGFGGRGRGR